MSDESDEVKITDSWKIDLEIALLEDADVCRIRSICNNRPLPKNSRPEVWRACLASSIKRTDAIPDFTEKLDLPNQSALRSDCMKAASDAIFQLNKISSTAYHSDSLAGSDNDSNYSDEVEESKTDLLPSIDQLSNDFEVVLSNFVHTYSLEYESSSGWVSFLRILYVVLRPISRLELFTTFATVFNRFIPSGKEAKSHLGALFRILLQYHDPTLSRMLDSLDLHPQFYAVQWMMSLFTESTITDEDVLLSIWDIYFLKADPNLGLFMSLVLVLSLKPNLFTEPNQQQLSLPSNFDRDDVLQLLLNLPKSMQLEDLNALIELTDVFLQKTPRSFQTQCMDTLFTRDNTHLLSTDGLCMSVMVQDVVKAQTEAMNAVSAMDDNTEDSRLRFLLVDCRPATQYNAGHLGTAFFLDSALLLSDQSQFDKTIVALLQTQIRALKAGSLAAGEHIAILSSGRAEEDRIANMVAAAFLKLNTPYVSLILGGYVALHDYLSPNDPRWVSHDALSCVVCCEKHNQPDGQPNQTQAVAKDTSSPKSPQKREESKVTPVRFFSKFSSTLFGSRASLSGKPESKQTPENKRLERDKEETSSKTAVPSQPPVSYRNTSSVFTIDDEVEGDEDEEFVQPTQTRSCQVEGSRGKENKRTFWPWNLVSGSTSLPSGDIPARSGGLDSSEPGDLIDTSQWSCRPEVRSVFDCQLIDRHGCLSEMGYLVLAERHILILVDHSESSSPFRMMSSFGSALQSVITGKVPTSKKPVSSVSRSKHALVLRSVPLSLIMRITANKRIPECITFHYSSKDPSDLLLINEQDLGTRDRIFIPQAGDAVRMIKASICTVLLNSNR